MLLKVVFDQSDEISFPNNKVEIYIKERIKRKIYSTREEARTDVFNYIEMFYNSKRRHGFNDGLPPVEYETKYFQEAGKCLAK